MKKNTIHSVFFTAVCAAVVLSCTACGAGVESSKTTASLPSGSAVSAEKSSAASSQEGTVSSSGSAVSAEKSSAASSKTESAAKSADFSKEKMAEFTKKQALADGGHMAGLLDPEDAAMTFVSDDLKLKNVSDDVEKTVTDGSAVVTLKKSGKAVMKLELCQPVKKGTGGIWVVSKWTDLKSNTVHTVS